MMYIVTENGNLVGKMNIERLERWLLKRRSPAQADLMMQSLSLSGHVAVDNIEIRRFVVKRRELNE